MLNKESWRYKIHEFQWKIESKIHNNPENYFIPSREA
jgi:hypothetical protein